MEKTQILAKAPQINESPSSEIESEMPLKKIYVLPVLNIK